MHVEFTIKGKTLKDGKKNKQFNCAKDHFALKEFQIGFVKSPVNPKKKRPVKTGLLRVLCGVGGNGLKFNFLCL